MTRFIPNIPLLKNYDNDKFFLIAGPCVIEDELSPLKIAEEICKVTEDLKIPFIFKASYKKANRSKLSSFTGIGDEFGLRILAKIREYFNIPVITDIHTEQEAIIASEYVDVLQIPAFLCRQTELIQTSAKTGKCVNIKKGQFASAEAMKFAIDKVVEVGNENVMITERGTTFGYSDLIVDFRNIPEMKTYEKPVVLDVTHSLQQPNQSAGVTGGKPELIPLYAKLGLVAGVDGLFIETHPEPEKAKSDGANMLRLSLLNGLLKDLNEIK